MCCHKNINKKRPGSKVAYNFVTARGSCWSLKPLSDSLGTIYKNDDDLGSVLERDTSNILRRFQKSTIATKNVLVSLSCVAIITHFQSQCKSPIIEGKGAMYKPRGQMRGWGVAQMTTISGKSVYIVGRGLRLP